jgi:hypothetical protein
MKKGRLLVLAILCWLGKTGFSQQVADSSSKWQYMGLFEAGWMDGSSDEAFGLLTTYAVGKNNWYPGISIGIDWYGIRSVPLMASVHRAFGVGNNQPFLFGGAGISLPWQQAPAVYENYPLATAKYRSGFIGEAGVGCWLKWKKDKAVSISAGYSYKTARLYGTYSSSVRRYPNDYSVPGFETKYRFQRLFVRLGFRL